MLLSLKIQEAIFSLCSCFKSEYILGLGWVGEGQRADEVNGKSWTCSGLYKCSYIIRIFVRRVVVCRPGKGGRQFGGGRSYARDPTTL